MSSISLYPALKFFYQRFQDRDNKFSSNLNVNIDNFTEGNEIDFKGACVVCAEKLNFSVKKFIRITGPGGVLIAAKKVMFEAPEIILEGTLEQPVQLVAIENFSIKALELKIQNVVIYLFNHENFLMKAPVISKFINVRVIKLSLENGTLKQKEIAFCKDEKALKSFQNESASKQTIEELLERIEFERETANKMGLRSILV